MPGKKHNVRKWITEIDNFDKSVVWRTIHNFHAEGTVITIAKLLVKLKALILKEAVQASELLGTSVLGGRRPG
jgi:hypothetical protein